VKRPGIQLQVVASLFVVMLSALGVAGALGAAAVVRGNEDAAFERLRMGANWLERALTSGMRTAEVAALARASGVHLVGGEFRVLDRSGRERIAAGMAPDPSRDTLARIARAALEGEIVERPGGWLSDLVLVRRVQAAEGGELFLYGRVYAEDLQGRILPLLRGGAWVLLIGAVVFLGFGGWLLRRTVVIPLLSLRRATRRIAAGELDAEVPSEGPAEIAELAEYFNDMAQSLERGRKQLIEAHRSLARSERLATVGQLAAGVAHEVGNPITAILGFAEFASRERTPAARARKTVVRIREEALRIQALVHEMLDLARVDQLALEVTDLGALLRRCFERLRAQPLLARVELRTELAGWLPAARVDPRRVEQILENLVRNSAQALAGIAGPVIRIRAAPVALRELRGRRLGDGATDAGDAPLGIAVDVEDNGPGIAEEDLAHVFDPFFTTKDPGEGTGLGLWNAHRFAEAMGGYLEVSSRPGATRFRLLLPASDTEAADGQPTDPDHR